MLSVMDHILLYHREAENSTGLTPVMVLFIQLNPNFSLLVQDSILVNHFIETNVEMLFLVSHQLC